MNPLNSRSWNLFQGCRSVLTPRSLIRLGSMITTRRLGLLRRQTTLLLKMKSPYSCDVRLRGIGSDFFTFGEMFCERVYEPVLSVLPNCKTIIDIGANIGLGSIYFAAHFRNAMILAVEANPITCNICEKNLSSLIAQGQCKVRNVAVWDKACMLTSTQSPSLDSSNSFSVREPNGDCDTSVTIVGLPIAELIEESGFDHVDLLKIDVEGAEVPIFNGDVNWLDTVDVLVVEFHRDGRQQCRFDKELRARNFQIFDERMSQHWHLVFAKKSPS